MKRGKSSCLRGLILLGVMAADFAALATVRTDAPIDPEMARPLLDHLLPPREAIDLCGPDAWQYAQVKQGTGFDDPTIRWDTVRVPARTFFNCGAPSDRPNTALYRKTFTLSEEQAKRHVEIRFELAGEHADVFVNGQLAGRSREWCLPFDVDATPFIKPGENRIDVRCWRDPDYSDGKKCPVTFGWLTSCYTGISRPVHVELSNQVRIRDLLVSTKVVGAKRLDVEVEVENQTERPVRIELVGTLKEGSENLLKIESGAAEIPSMSVRKVKLGGVCAAVRAWNPDSPNLYNLDLSLVQEKSSSVVLDAVRQRIGFTEVRIEGNRVLFNGHPMLNRRDSVSLGSCQDWKLNPSGERMRKLIALYKRRGFVSRRCDVATLVREARVCDEEGFLFSPLLPTGPAYAREPPYWGNVSNMVAKAARRFRNHPSLLYWCLFNEFGKFYGVSTWKEQYPKMCAMGDWLMENDPARFWTSCGDAELDANEGGGPGPAPVRSVHYPVNMCWSGIFPEVAYWYAEGRPSWQGLARRDKPLFISEDLYHGMNDVSWCMGRWGGDSVYTTEGYIKAWQACIQMCADGLYYSGLSEWNPWFLHTENEKNELFSEGELLPTWHISRRHGYLNLSGGSRYEDELFVFNQSFTAREVVLSRQDLFNGEAVNTSKEKFILEPGARKDLKLEVRVPTVKGSCVKPYEVRFELRTVDGERLAHRTYTFNVIPEAKRLPKGIVLLVGGTNACPLETLFSADRVFTQAEKALAGKPKVIVCAGELSGAEGRLVDSYVQQGGRAVFFAPGVAGGWSPLRILDRQSHSYAFRRDDLFLPDVPESVFRVWRPDSQLGQYAIEKPVRRDARILVDNCDSSGFNVADIVRVAQGRGDWLVTSLPIVSRFEEEPAARYLAARLIAYEFSESALPSGGYAFLDKNHPFAEIFRQDGFLEPVGLRSAKAVFVDGAKPLSEKKVASVLSLAKAGATVFVTDVTTNGAATALLANLSLTFDPVPPYVPQPGPGRYPPLDDYRRHWFTRTSNTGLLAGLSNTDFFFATSTLCNYFAWKAQGVGAVRADQPPLVPGLFIGGEPLLDSAAMSEVCVGKGRIVVSSIPWTYLMKKYPTRCLRVWRTFLGNAGVKTADIATPHTIIPIRMQGDTLLWDAPKRDSKRKAWFGNGDDMRYFPVNLCGWSWEANNKCPVEPFPVDPMNFGGIAFQLTPQDNARGSAVSLNLGIANSPNQKGTRLDRIWVLAALEDDANLKVGDVVVDALIENGTNPWHTAPKLGAVAKYGVHVGAYRHPIPLKEGRIGWEGHSEKTKRACLYVFSIENPFDKSIPVRHVFVRGGEQVGKGKPNVAILGLSWQVY